MSQRPFTNRRQKRRLKQGQYSEKSVNSVMGSHTSRKKVDTLTKKLEDLSNKRNQVRKQAINFWQEAKKFEAEGLMDMALKAKKMYEKEFKRVKSYYNEIIEVEKRIDNILLVYSVKGTKGKNYAKIRVKEPPSDNQSE